MFKKVIIVSAVMAMLMGNCLSTNAAAMKISGNVRAAANADQAPTVPTVPVMPDPQLTMPAPVAPVTPAVPPQAPVTAPLPAPEPAPAPTPAPAPVSAPAESEGGAYAAADKVLAAIITPGMSETDKCRVIYNWVKGHIKYSHQNNHSDWVKAASTGFTKGRGDCYIYYSTARMLLTRAGINNMEIHKIPAKTEHYWNLVNLGSGWLHFDCTPRKDDRTFFLWNDAKLMEYSNSHNKSHNYDRNVYSGIVP